MATNNLERVIASVFEQSLAPVGFERGTHAFVRRSSEHYHGIQFQRARGGGRCFLNVMFHYACLPDMLTKGSEQKTCLQFDVVDFLIHGRLQDFDNDVDHRDLQIDIEFQAAVQQFQADANAAINALDKFSIRWRDPLIFAETLYPPIIEIDAYARNEANWRPGVVNQVPGMLRDILGVRWNPHPYFSLSYAMALLAKHGDNSELAQRYFVLAQSQSQGVGHDRQLTQLRKLINT